MDLTEEKVIQQEGGGENPPAPPVDPPVDVPVFDFAAQSGGRFTSWDDVNNAIEGLQREVSTRVKPEEVYADPRLAAANDLLKKGASEEEMFNFLRVSRMNVTQMGEKEAILEGMKIKFPEFTDKQILDEYEEQFGFDQEDPQAADRAGRKLIMAAKDAKAAISAYIGEVSKPASVQSKEAEATARGENAQKWAQALSRVESVSTPPVKYKNGDLELEFSLPVNVTGEVRNFVSRTMAGEVPDEESVQSLINKDLLSIAISSDPVSFLNSFVETVGAKIAEHFVRKSENNPPLERREGDAAAAAAKSGDASTDSFNAMIRAARGM